ncbi:hypothetical protein [Nostocoides vanveenii]|uniref:hypothetical protein n=1 Tax=Nostocoides vanveenii TaxID=330835 RepID=UPI0031D4173A
MTTEPRGPRHAPERVRVTASRRQAPRHTTRPVAEELSDQTTLGTIYLHGLMRAQLRLALSILIVGTLTIGIVPLAFALIPAARTLPVGPLPLPWLVLGLAVYPAAVLAARFYVRAAERLESAFVDVVNRS